MTDTVARRSPNMQDVAEVAGVSHQTVSRVLNGFENIRPETRDRVLAAISQLGYRRNAAARVLATSRTHAIGALVIAVIANGLGLLGLPAGVNFLVTGGVLILAATIDAVSRKRGAGALTR